MKKLLSTVCAIALTTAGGVAFAAGDEAEDIAPNALMVIVSTPSTAPVRYDTDESMDVAPNATAAITPSPAGAPPRNEDEAMDVAPNAKK
jgi:hypothetical protein